jgi:hypothetical protein
VSKFLTALAMKITAVAISETLVKFNILGIVSENPSRR